MAWPVIRDVLLVVALAPFAYYAVAIIAATRFFRDASSARPVSDFAPPVSILKPIFGLDRETYANYASFCHQEYPEYEILFCVSDDADPAIPVIEQLVRNFPKRGIRLLVGSEHIGTSDKVNKLCRMAREARHDILIVSDSDVRVAPGFLRAVVAAFRNPQIGGVTCLYRGLTDGTWPADLEALGNSADFAPSVLVSRLLAGGTIDFMLGAVMATTKAHLAEIGGFESLADYFCDDYELGHQIAARGHRIELSRCPVDIVYPHESLADAFRHQVRWNLSIRFSRPWGHLGLLFTHALSWTILAAAIAPRAPVAAAFIAAYLVLRAGVAWSVGVRGMKDDLARRKMWMLPVRDAFGFLVWLGSFFPRRILWRGQPFLIRRKRLVPAAPQN